MVNEYTKEDATSFGKLLNKFLVRLNSPNFNRDYFKKKSYIAKHLANQDYTKYIMDLVDLLVKNLDCVKEDNVWMSVDTIMHMKFEDLPLHINGDAIIHELARWRLKVGK